MLEDVVTYLRCPNCGGGLTLEAGVLTCPARHSFDVARQGYVSLLRGDQPRVPGDSAAMVAARERFLGAGHFAPVTEELARVAAWLVAARAAAVGSGTAGRDAAPPRTTVGADGVARERFPLCVIDAGAGAGHYLAALLDTQPDAVGIALDTSKHALRRAARVHPRAGAIGCDIWRGLPLADGVATLALNVFAPRNGGELARVLKPEGQLVVVTPTPRHMAELTDALGLLRVDERKQERLDAKLGPFLTVVEQHEREWPLELSEQDAADAVAMGPSAWHAHARPTGPLAVTASITVSVYQRQPARTRTERV